MLNHYSAGDNITGDVGDTALVNETQPDIGR